MRELKIGALGKGNEANKESGALGRGKGLNVTVAFWGRGRRNKMSD